MIENKVYQIINQAANDMVIALNLDCYPAIKYESDAPYVMAAGGSLCIRGDGHYPRITDTDSDYVLHVNPDRVSHMMDKYKCIFHSMKAAYDYLYLVVCHELRHMWQYQEGYMIGTVHNSELDEITSSLYGHGSKIVEQDANNWMISVAEIRGIKDIATYMELEQRANGLVNELSTEFKRNILKTYISTVKQYNVIQYLIYKTRSKLAW